MDPAEHDEPHLPAPTIGPVGFAVGVVVVLVGLIVNPLWISTIGAAIAVIFAFVWAREATAELRGRHVAAEPELREGRRRRCAGGGRRAGDCRRPSRASASRAASSSRARRSASAP